MVFTTSKEFFIHLQEKSKTCMSRLIKSFGYAWQGIRSVFSTEANMKIHAGVAVLVIVAGFLMKISLVEWIAVMLCIGLVFSAEMFNTTIELLVDKISPQKDPVAGKVKDIAAGAVLIAACISVVVGVIIFLPKIIQWII